MAKYRLLAERKLTEKEIAKLDDPNNMALWSVFEYSGRPFNADTPEELAKYMDDARQKLGVCVSAELK